MTGGGIVTSIIVAWATETVSDDMGIANVALVLALVCVAAALVHPAAGLITSAAAALALNYFHTTPVHSLRMSEGDQIITVVLLIVHGTAVSAGATLRARTKISSHRVAVSHGAGHDLRTLLAEGGPLTSAWQAAVVADSRDAASLEVTFLADGTTALPVIGRNPTGAANDTVLVPETGAVLELPHGHGALLVKPQPGVGAVETTRAHLVRCADQIAAALDG